jgi:hypothetical protein
MKRSQFDEIIDFLWKNRKEYRRAFYINDYKKDDYLKPTVPSCLFDRKHYGGLPKNLRHFSWKFFEAVKYNWERLLGYSLFCDKDDASIITFTSKNGFATAVEEELKRFREGITEDYKETKKMKKSKFDEITDFLWKNRKSYGPGFYEDDPEITYYFDSGWYGGLPKRLCNFSSEFCDAVQENWSYLIGYDMCEKEDHPFKNKQEFKNTLEESLLDLGEKIKV